MKGALVVYLLLVWTLLEETRNLHYILFVLGMGISHLHGFLAALPTSGSWFSTSCMTIKNAYDVIQNAGSQAWCYFLRAVRRM
jgi:hypothetical protein